MNENEKNAKHDLSGQNASTAPCLETDEELTPEAEAIAANSLTPSEQLDRFEKDQELHDGGNQPA